MHTVELLTFEEAALSSRTCRGMYHIFLKYAPSSLGIKYRQGSADFFDLLEKYRETIKRIDLTGASTDESHHFTNRCFNFYRWSFSGSLCNFFPELTTITLYAYKEYEDPSQLLLPEDEIMRT